MLFLRSIHAANCNINVDTIIIHSPINRYRGDFLFFLYYFFWEHNTTIILYMFLNVHVQKFL